MAQTATKLEYPTGQDPFQPHRDMKRLAESAGVIVPVANRAEADAVADVFQPAPNKPLYVDRQDTATLERNRGDGWVAFARKDKDGLVQKGLAQVGGLQPNETENVDVTFNPILQDVPDIIVVPSGSNRLIFRVVSSSISQAGFTAQARNVSTGGTSDGSFRWFAFV